MIFFSLLLSFLPLSLFLVCCLLPAPKRGLLKISNSAVIPLLLIFTITIGLYPYELSSDKSRYISMYYASLFYSNSYEFRDVGWIVYNRLCAKVFGNSYELFFLLTAFVYVFGFYYFARRFFPRDYTAYYLLMAVGSLGFSSYGTNVIRAGLAISLLLIAASMKTKLWIKIIIVIVSITFHKSIIIPIVAFILGKYFKSNKLVTLYWTFCLLLSAVNFDMGPIFESVGFVDERVESYAGSIGEMDGNYEQKFRVDFLIYSVVPLVLALYYVVKKHLSDTTYLHFIRMYMLANGVWLLAIRMAYSDRLAYLSWFMIPFVTLYPVVNYQKVFNHPKAVVLIAMAMFLGVRVYLSLRSVQL